MISETDFINALIDNEYPISLKQLSIFLKYEKD